MGIAACAGPPAVEPTPPIIDTVVIDTTAVTIHRETVPPFAFQALDDTSRVFTPADFDGRFVLVDVWASWCAPCLEEIPRIAALHEEYGDRLDVLSVSLDLYRDDVAAFRKRFAPMPWLHAFVPERPHPSLVALGADRVPYAVLVGPDGTVRARGGQLRRDLLRITIERELQAHDDAP